MRFLTSCMVLTGSLALFSPSESLGQTLEPGDRIRVTAPPLLSQPQRGRLISLDQDSLVLEGTGLDRGQRGAAPTRWIVPRELLSQLEMSQGYRRYPGRGFLIGAGVGLVGGLIAIGSGNGSACRGSGDYGEVCAYFVGASTAGGGLVGLLFGAVVRTERWTPLSLERP
jgi:hypothetical protein